ncbi:hypothetical protein [Nostoc sp.]|uniref:hypothetical protein n=1 Tax=Nostoc sp. TaxID=1180 RepID=UPI002FF5E761
MYKTQYSSVKHFFLLSVPGQLLQRGNSRNALASLRLCGLIENQYFETPMVRGVQRKYDRRVLFV